MSRTVECNKYVRYFLSLIIHILLHSTVRDIFKHFYCGFMLILYIFTHTKRRDFLSLVFTAKSISQKVLVKIIVKIKRPQSNFEKAIHFYQFACFIESLTKKNSC